MTDQPEPLPTVPESVPRDEAEVAAERKFPARNRDPNILMLERLAFVDGARWASAPRPVPETAATCVHCGHLESDQVLIKDDGHVVGDDVWYCQPCGPGFGVHDFERPAPPAEPVEAQRYVGGVMGADFIHEVQEDPDAGLSDYQRGELAGYEAGRADRPPVEEAHDRFSLPKVTSEFIRHGVEVEDEGARPQHRVRRDGIRWWWGQKGESVFVPNEVEAGIRKEATAAQDDELETAWEQLRQRDRQYDDQGRELYAARASARTERTRAEAAEGARDEQARAIVSAMDFIARGKATTAYNILRGARALTAESVTPTGEAQ